MLSDRDALLAAIRAHPEEDTPRLMLADWLDEQGDDAARARAEFVRLQCEQARLADDGSDSHAVYEFVRDRDNITRPSADWTKIDDGIHRRVALAVRADDLLKRLGEGWLPALPKRCKVEWGGFHRGFPHRVTLGDLRRLKEAAPYLRKAAPAVTLVEAEFTPKFVDQLADAGLLGWLAGLDVRNDCAAGLREFGHRPEAAGVRALAVRYGDANDVASAVADSPHWTGLRTFDLSNTATGPEATETLFRAKSLRTLKRLHILRAGNWTTDTVRALAAGAFSELTSLRLLHCGLDDDAAEVLAACPHLANLRTLDLGHNSIGGRGVTALLTSPHLANVAFLGLDHNTGVRVLSTVTGSRRPNRAGCGCSTLTGAGSTRPMSANSPAARACARSGISTWTTPASARPRCANSFRGSGSGARRSCGSPTTASTTAVRWCWRSGRPRPRCGCCTCGTTPR